MPNRMHRVRRPLAVLVAVVSSVAVETVPVTAANRVAVGVPAVVPLIGIAHARTPALRMTSLSPRRLLSTSVAASPIRVLPLVGSANHVTTSIVGWLPRLGVAALLAGGGSPACAAPRRPVELSVLPANPFVAGDCARRAFTDAESSLPPTSLVAGHNRDALYGPAFTATSDQLR